MALPFVNGGNTKSVNFEIKQLNESKKKNDAVHYVKLGALFQIK